MKRVAGADVIYVPLETVRITSKRNSSDGDRSSSHRQVTSLDSSKKIWNKRGENRIVKYQTMTQGQRKKKENEKKTKEN